ncbi:MAG: helix-turn-helix transcriptional regulator [Lactobacillaceae bacterium]|jgi:DNA-binding phage protein|nr:helix-turn-helix transcriptional regulator [Lactobacillaceae bacterium]
MNRENAEHITQNVVDLLEKERVKRKITKTEINTKTGLSRTAWTLTVSKKNSPTLRTLLMVADVIGIDLKEVIRQAEK